MKALITFPKFLEVAENLEIKTGTIVEVDEVPKSAKLLKMGVDFGNGQLTVVVTNIKPLIAIDELKGSQYLFVTNLEPTKIMGIESFAMILPGQLEEGKIVKAIGQPGTLVL